MMPAAAFDALAPAYDATFTASDLGRILRRRVQRWLDRAFAPGQTVLELNCGTGEDALHLAARGVRVFATDASAAMLGRARAKVAGTHLASAVTLRQLAIEDLGDLVPGHAATFDGACSTFGGLNCVANLPAAARSLAALLAPGARAVLGLMGPIVPWEWAWFLAHGAARTAFRRFAKGGVRWRGVTVRYPSIRQARRAFAPHFALRRAGGLGVFVPPTYAEPWARRHPRLVGWLDRWERRTEQWPVLPWLGDHYLLELERR